jgi:hypothetical protein
MCRSAFFTKLISTDVPRRPLHKTNFCRCATAPSLLNYFLQMCRGALFTELFSADVPRRPLHRADCLLLCGLQPFQILRSADQARLLRVHQWHGQCRNFSNHEQQTKSYDSFVLRSWKSSVENSRLGPLGIPPPLPHGTQQYCQYCIVEEKPVYF